MNRKKILSTMRRILRYDQGLYVDSVTEQLNCTALAEATAQELGRDCWLDDPDHIVWECAYQVATEQEELMRGYSMDYGYLQDMEREGRDAL